MFPKRFVLILVTLGAILLGPATALAGTGVYITLVNDLPPTAGFPGYPHARIHNSGGSDCWYDNNLAADDLYAESNSSKQFYTEAKESGLCGGTHVRGARIDIQVGPGAPWISPPKMDDLTLKVIGSSKGITTTLEGVPSRWVPIGRDGDYPARGLVCLSSSWWTKQSPGATAHGTVTLSDTGCTGASTPSGAGTGGGGGGSSPPSNTAVFDVLTMAASGCDWLAGASPATAPAKCAEITDPTKWDLNEVAADVRNFKVSGPATSNGSVQVATTTNPICNLHVTIPAGAQPGTLTCDKSDERTNKATSTTSHAYDIGSQLTEKFRMVGPVPFMGRKGGVNWTQSFDFTWTSTHANEKDHAVTVEAKFSTPALPGYTTHLDVNATSGVETSFNYSADLSMGGNNAAGRPIQPGVDVVPGDYSHVSSPAFTALGMSAVREQWCLPILIGNDKVGNSLQSIAEQMRLAGAVPGGYGVPQWQTDFLLGTAGFTTYGQGCPGYPTADGASFASAARFLGQGTATVRYGALNTDGKLPEGETPVVSTEACVWLEPAPPTTTGNACGPATGTTSITPGQYLATAAPIVATGAGAQKVVATSKSRQDITTGAGNDVIVASGAGDTVHAGAGDDRLSGGRGADILDAGTGGGQVIARGGNDRIVIAAGQGAVALGGNGGDVLTVRGAGTAWADGGSGADRIVLTGTDPAAGSVSGHVIAAGGSGDDTYVVTAGAPVPGIVETPDHGTDTVVTGRSMTIPAGIEVVRTTGTKGVRLVSASTPERIIAGPAGASIWAHGHDTVIGGAGRDVVRFDVESGVETAAGGGEGDLFIPTGPLPETRGAGTALLGGYPAADTVVDFSEAAGDRIGLSVRSLGSRVRRLTAGGVAIRTAGSALPNGPVLVLNPANGLVSFDADGAGRAPGLALVRLVGVRSLSIGDFVVVR